MKGSGKVCIAGLVAALAVTLSAAEYKYIISDNSENVSSPFPSEPVALNTASLSADTSVTCLDARFRTLLETEPIRLNTFPAVGFLLFLK